MSRLEKQPSEWIDRTQVVSFRFEGRRYTGYEGDTISTALWASGVRVLGRSFKYHRPRGIFGLADTDCNVMFESGEVTNVRGDATLIRDSMRLRAVNTWGGVDWDLGQFLDHLSPFMPVGFYYKAFHTPPRLFPFYERQIRRMAGLGSVRPQQSFSLTSKEYDSCGILVVGAGPAGLSAALVASRAGADVLVVDDNLAPGGSLLYQRQQAREAGLAASAILEELTQYRNCRIRTRTVAAGYYQDQWVALIDQRCLTKLRSRAMIVATGAHEQPAVFRNNDLPGVMLGSAAQRLIHLYAVSPFERGAILTASPEGYRFAFELLEAGIEVAAIVDLRPGGEASDVAHLAGEAGIAIFSGFRILEAVPAFGKRGIRGVRITDGPEAAGAGRRGCEQITCDGVAICVGWAPADGLLRQAGAKMVYAEELEQFIPAEGVPGVFAAGRVNGVYPLKDQMADGAAAGLEAVSYVGLKHGAGDPAGPAYRRPDRSSSPNHPYAVSPHPRGKNFIDLDEDLQLKDLENAFQEGYDCPELLKRYTSLGMGPSQGRHSNLLALRVLSRLQGESMVGKRMTTARPFTTSVPLGHLAGRNFTPVRRTPLHARNQALEAQFMYAGNWLRPEYYRLGSLSRCACINQEVTTVRRNVGLIDLGTLGKIEVAGPDAARFLEQVYTGSFAELAAGCARYGVMCDESGIIIDDGIVARLGGDRFYITTTSSGSDTVYRELQRWAVMWELNVTLANVTSHFGALNLAGPLSRELLQPLTDVSLRKDRFPYLGFREGYVCGCEARLFRVGFVGELGYEIHLPADATEVIWDALLQSGRPHGIRPFGAEAQRMLRLEKAHLIVGQDTDGLTNPFEAGLKWAVKMRKPFFVGQRSLAILARSSPQRHLVGFALPPGYQGPAPAECQLIIAEDEVEGRVTSVGFSPMLSRIIGLAYVHPRNREPGSRLHIRIDRRLIGAEVVNIPFYDPENERQN